MRKRVYTGDYGRLTGSKLFPGFASPETVKLYFPRFHYEVEESQYPVVSLDLRYWAFGDKLYQSLLQDGKPLEFVEEGLGYFIDRGTVWTLFENRLLWKDKRLSPRYSHPVPDIRNNSVQPWVQGWNYGGVVERPLLYYWDISPNSTSLILGRWGFSPVQFSFTRPTMEYNRLEAYIAQLKNPWVIEAFRKKQMEFPPMSIAIPNPLGLYHFDFYDTEQDEENEITFSIADHGGLWTENTVLRTHGERSWGRGYLVCSMFQKDGVCLGFSAVNNSILHRDTSVDFVPTEKGVLMVEERSGENQYGMKPVRLPFRSWEKDTQKFTEYSMGQKGTSQGVPIFSGYCTGLFPPYFYFVGEGLLRGWIPPLYGNPEEITGGAGSTLLNWFTEGQGVLKKAWGPFLPVSMPDNDRVVDIRDFRKHLLEGKFEGVELRNDVLWGNSVKSTPTETGQKLQVFSSPLGKAAPLFSVKQNILPEHIICPWLATVGEPLELGWWDFPQVGIKGSPPNLSWLNREWTGENAQWQHGGNDHYWGDLGWVRCSLSVTSDGYVYIAGDSGKATAIGFKYNGTEWKAGRSDFPVSDTRVAPLGQGCYYIYHFPGEDWSILHAPVGEVNYRRLWESTDWSFLWALTGLAGGFALAGQLQVQEAFDKYMSASLGNLMLIYTIPRQLLVVGDTLFNQSEVIVKEDNHFWTFTGWARIDDQPHAIFSKIRDMGASNPEVWAVGKNGARQINPSEAGEAGEKAFGLIPSNYYPRWGIYPGGEPLSEGWELIFPGEYYHYPMPELPQEADAALAQQFLDNLKMWENKADNINRPKVVVGQSFNHQILDTAVIDPSVPIADIRIQKREGKTWISVQHLTGMWVSIQGDEEFDRYDFESETGWQLLSLGVEKDGTVVALFQVGLIDMDTYRTFDYQLQLYFGMGRAWHNFSIWKWPARIVPIVIAQDVNELNKLWNLFQEEEE